MLSLLSIIIPGSLSARAALQPCVSRLYLRSGITLSYVQNTVFTLTEFHAIADCPVLQSRSLYRNSHPLHRVNSTSQFIIISKLAKDTFNSHIPITNGEQKWPHFWALGNTSSDCPPVRSIITIKNWGKKALSLSLFVSWPSSSSTSPVFSLDLLLKYS